MLAHRFVGGANAPPLPALQSALVSAVDGKTRLAPVLARDSARPRYHIFISHAQAEASGDVGTLFHALERIGVHGWRDMNQADLTEAAMRRGVYDSDVFIVFLTNSYLARTFCIAELTWALEFGKPIIVVVEEEGRFWPFDLQRWKAGRLAKVAAAHGGSAASAASAAGGAAAWGVDCELQVTHAECPRHIRELIEARCASGSMLPFRRREFEVDAMVHEIVRRSSACASVSWGAGLLLRRRSPGRSPGRSPSAVAAGAHPCSASHAAQRSSPPSTRCR